MYIKHKPCRVTSGTFRTPAECISRCEATYRALIKRISRTHRVYIALRSNISRCGATYRELAEFISRRGTTYRALVKCISRRGTTYRAPVECISRCGVAYCALEECIYPLLQNTKKRRAFGFKCRISALFVNIYLLFREFYSFTGSPLPANATAIASTTGASSPLVSVRSEDTNENLRVSADTPS